MHFDWKIEIFTLGIITAFINCLVNLLLSYFWCKLNQFCVSSAFRDFCGFLRNETILLIAQKSSNGQLQQLAVHHCLTLWLAWPCNHIDLVLNELADFSLSCMRQTGMAQSCKISGFYCLTGQLLVLDGQDQSWSLIEMNQMVMSVREVALELVFYQFCMKNIYSILAPLAELQSHNPKQLTLIQNT